MVVGGRSAVAWLLLGAVLLAMPGGCAKAPAQPGPPPAPVPPRSVDGQLPDTAHPTAYRLRLDLAPYGTAFHGHVAIDVRIPRPTRAIVLHARSLRVESVRVSTAEGRLQAGEAFYRNSTGAKQALDELVLTFREAVSGEATLSLGYRGEFSKNLTGLYRGWHGGRPYVLTQFEPTGARLAFPCPASLCASLGGHAGKR